MTSEEWEKWAERQKERQEALAESLEILTHDVHELQGRIGALTILSQENLRSTADLRAAIHELLLVVESHERRMTKLEGGEPPAPQR
jgi:hypothetical protein